MTQTRCTSTHPDIATPRQCKLYAGHDGMHELEGRLQMSWTLTVTERAVWDAERRAAGLKRLEAQESAQAASDAIWTQDAEDLGRG